MKLTKGRIRKLYHKKKQSRKRGQGNKVAHESNDTFRKKKPLNLMNKTLKTLKTLKKTMDKKMVQMKMGGGPGLRERIMASYTIPQKIQQAIQSGNLVTPMDDKIQQRKNLSPEAYKASMKPLTKTEIGTETGNNSIPIATHVEYIDPELNVVGSVINQGYQNQGQQQPFSSSNPGDIESVKQSIQAIRELLEQHDSADGAGKIEISKALESTFGQFYQQLIYDLTKKVDAISEGNLDALRGWTPPPEAEANIAKINELLKTLIKSNKLKPEEKAELKSLLDSFSNALGPSSSGNVSGNVSGTALGDIDNAFKIKQKSIMSNTNNVEQTADLENLTKAKEILNNKNLRNTYDTTGNIPNPYIFKNGHLQGGRNKYKNKRNKTRSKRKRSQRRSLTRH